MNEHEIEILCAREEGFLLGLLGKKIDEKRIQKSVMDYRIQLEKFRDRR